MAECMLTTVDNPYNPFTQFDEWYRFDQDKGYGTDSYLARIAIVDDQMPETVYDEEVERAIDEICGYNFLGIYKKVTKDDYKNGKWIPREVKIPEIENEKLEEETNMEK